MKKKMKLHILSSICDKESSECERAESEHSCLVECVGGVLRISSVELIEGEECRSSYILHSDRLTVTRRGAVSSEMRFSLGKTEICSYSVSGYAMDMRIFTNKLSGELGPLGGELSLSYEMELGGVTRVCDMTITLSGE